MKTFLLGTMAAIGLAAPVMAADLPVRAPVAVAAAYNWSGCFIGVQGGGAWGRSRHDGYPPGPIELTPTFNLSGGEAGVEYGCNYRLSQNVLFGTESDFSWTNKKGSSFDTGPGGVPTFLSTTKEHWISTTRLRLGVISDRTLFYITGGLAAASVEAGLNTNIVGIPIFSEKRTLWGGTVGGGIEYALMNNWSVKAEYLFMAFQDKAFRFNDDPTVVALSAQRSSLNLTDHIVRVGINYKFTDCLLFCGAVSARY